MLAHLYELGVYSLAENGDWHQDRGRVPEFLRFQTRWSF
jgi:hypothetical protein